MRVVLQNVVPQRLQQASLLQVYFHIENKLVRAEIEVGLGAVRQLTWRMSLIDVIHSL